MTGQRNLRRQPELAKNHILSFRDAMEELQSAQWLSFLGLFLAHPLRVGRRRGLRDINQSLYYIENKQVLHYQRAYKKY